MKDFPTAKELREDESDLAAFECQINSIRKKLFLAKSQKRNYAVYKHFISCEVFDFLVEKGYRLERTKKGNLRISW